MLKIKTYIFLFICLISIKGWSQSINTPFGKNRIQYHENFKYWWVYETQNFKTYWYDRGKNVGITVLQMAEMDFKEIQDLLEHRFNDKIEIIVYSDLTDLKMSNIGLEETFITVSGRTKVSQNKIFVHFNGSHADLRKQIRQGVAEVFINAMLFGNSFQEFVQNAVMFNVPDWYKQGISKYVETEWDEKSDDELRNLLNTNKRRYKDYKRLSKEYPQLAGHSFWNFIGDTYGKSAISNLLYLTRINRNMEAAFIYVLGVPYKQLRTDWYQYYQKQYRDLNPQLDQLAEEDILPAKFHKRAKVSNLKISPNGQYLAYAVNRIGKAQVYIYDFNLGKRFQVLKVGKRNPLEITDFNYPILCWSNDGNELSIIYEYRDIVKHKRIFFDRDEEIEDLFAPEYRRIYSADYLNDEELIISATTDGFSDLYQYNMRNRQSIRLTNDFYDDVDIKSATIDGKAGVLFVSNRKDIYLVERKLDTILPIDNFDVFFLEFGGENKLHQISKTPSESERLPIMVDDNQIAFLASGSGIVNRKIAQIESLDYLPQSYYNSNVNSNILNHESNGKDYFYVERSGLRQHILSKDIDFTMQTSPVVTEFKKINKGLSTIKKSGSDEEVVHIKTSSYIDPAYYFQTEFEETKKEQTDIEFSLFPTVEEIIQKDRRPSQEIVKYINSRAIAAGLRFRVEDVVSRMDNSVLFEGLDSYAGDRQEAYQHAPFGYLIKANVKDIFEDYSFEGGFRIPTALNGSEVFLTFDDKKKRIDKRYALYRKSFSERPNFFGTPTLNTRKNTFIAMYQLKYPLDFFTSIRGSLTYRSDQFFDLVTDETSFDEPIINAQRLGLKLEYVYDNTFDIDANIKNGLRYKFYVEAINKFSLTTNPGFNFKLSESFMTVAGLDARHYLPIGRYGVWANRVAAGTNFGSERILYYMGGVESWLFPVFNMDTPTPQNNYAFTTIAPNLRGFKYNSRNGTSFALFNSELRLPIFNMISAGRIKYKFIRNFQLVGFFDAGAAWHGLTPYSEENIINTITLESPPTVVVNIKYFRDPLIYGYGVGARTSFFGYIVKVDYAWGVETRIVQKPRLYISFGADF